MDFLAKNKGAHMRMTITYGIVYLFYKNHRNIIMADVLEDECIESRGIFEDGRDCRSRQL